MIAEIYIRLFLHDAGIDFNDVRYKYDQTWTATSEDLQKKGISRTGKVPELEYQGVILSQVCSDSLILHALP